MIFMSQLRKAIRNPGGNDVSKNILYCEENHFRMIFLKLIPIVDEKSAGFAIVPNQQKGNI